VPTLWTKSRKRKGKITVVAAASEAFIGGDLGEVRAAIWRSEGKKKTGDDQEDWGAVAPRQAIIRASVGYARQNRLHFLTRGGETQGGWGEAAERSCNIAYLVTRDFVSHTHNQHLNPL